MGVSLNIESMSEVFKTPEHYKAFQDENTDVRVRTQIMRETANDFEIGDHPTIQEALEGYSGHVPKHMFEDPRRKERWNFWFENSKAFQGGRSGNVRRATEVLLDNTLFHIMHEHLDDYRYRKMSPQKFVESMFDETTLSTNVQAFPRIALPVVRRAMPPLLFDSLFAIIPVTQPNVKVPLLRRKYAETHTGGAVAGNEPWPYQGANYDEHYGGARVEAEEIGTGDGAAQNFDLSYTPTYDHEIYIDGVLQTTGYAIATGAGAGGVDQVQFTVAPVLAEVLTASYDNRTELDAGRKMRIDITLVDVDGDIMMLSSDYSFEADHHFRSFYGLAIQQEIPNMLRQELAQMLDTIALNECMNQANAGNAVFDATGYMAGDTNTSARNSYDANLYRSLVSASQDLFDLHRQWPTYIVAGSGAAEALMRLETFNFAPSSQNVQQVILQQRTVNQGFIGNRWVLYQNPKLASNRAFFGWPSVFPFLVGYIITMYLPFFISPEIWKENANLQRARGAATWAGRQMIDPTQYSTLEIQNLSL